MSEHRLVKAAKEAREIVANPRLLALKELEAAIVAGHEPDVMASLGIEDTGGGAQKFYPEREELLFGADPNRANNFGSLAAFQGCLSNAYALHKAVLPGWRYQIDNRFHDDG